MIIDIDMAYSFIARRDPSLYLLFHGGFNHSFFGATILSFIAFGITLILSTSGLIPAPMMGAIVIPAIAAVLAGAYLHVFLDYLAAPGLPLLYPLTEKRFGLSLFPMPVYFLSTLLALVSLGSIFVWGLSPELVMVYGVIFNGIIIVSLGMKRVVYQRTHGRSYPTFHLFQWIVIREEDASYSVMFYDIFRGMIRELSFEKYRDITPSDAHRYDNLPEVRRHRYFSYINTVEKNGSGITFRDPVRDEGLISYPPWYPSVTVNSGEATPSVGDK
ncbi:MAG: metal-dependent hydrolase [Methanoregulaceae archaeon]|nr:metal-dependent hydrolase [Methanoregulaceae archaeon]